MRKDRGNKRGEKRKKRMKGGDETIREKAGTGEKEGRKRRKYKKKDRGGGKEEVR